MEGQNVKKKLLPSQKVSISALTVAIFFVLLALLLDFIAFKDTILTFVAGIAISALAFVAFCIFFVVSFVLIFGFFLVEEHGFWPLPLSISFFKEVMGEVQITAEQVAQFRTFKIIMLVLSFALLALSIVAHVMTQNDIKAGLTKEIRNTKGNSTAALTMAILGVLVSAASIAISSAI